MNPLHRAKTPRSLFANLRPSFTAASIALLSTLVAPATAQDAQSYPNKPVRIFIPFGAGGVGDLTTRLLAQKLGETSGQQFVIENRPGAGGSIAMKATLAAEPDGYS